MWRGESRYFSRNTRPSPKALSASEEASRQQEAKAWSFGTTRMPLPPPPATAFRSTGITHVTGNRLGLFRIFDGFVGAGDGGDISAAGKLFAGGLRAHRLHGFRGRADESDTGIGAGARQGGIFRKEAVAGMNGVATGTACDVDQLIDAKIAFAGRSGADKVSLIGKPDVQRGAVHFAVNANRGNVQFAAGAQDAHGDFTAIGD